MGLLRFRKKEPRPAEEIELSSKHVKLRFALVIAFIVIAVTAFVVGVTSLRDGGEAGWYRIGVYGSMPSLGDEMVLTMELGMNGQSVSAENKAVTAVYTDASVYAYRLFHPTETVGGMGNVATVNKSVNTAVTVDAPLYEAFSLVKTSGDRSIFLAPAYQYLQNLFTAENDTEAENYDPAKNPETADFFRAVCAFASDPASVDLTLLGDNRVLLSVSEEYLAFARENDFSVFVDFFRLKNAFAADMIAEKLIAAGYTRGALSTDDGFARNLDDSGIGFAVNLYDKNEEKGIFAAAQLTYSGRRAFCTVRSFALDVHEPYRYEYENGESVTAYLNAENGLPENSVRSFFVYSDSRSCAELALAVSPLCTGEWNDAALAADGIHYVCCDGGFVRYDDAEAVLAVSADSGYRLKLDS